MNLSSAQIDINQIFKRCGSKADSRISVQSFEEIWNQFLKWCQSQFDQDRTIIVPNFMQIYSKSLNKSEQDKDKFIQLQLVENFLFNNNLKFTSPIETKYPAVKINYTQVGKTANVDKDLAYQAISEIFLEIQELLSEGKDQEINLNSLGKLTVINRQISFTPYIKTKPQNVHQKQTVQSMLTLSRSFKNQKLDSISQSSEMESQIIIQEQPLYQRLKQTNSKFCQNPTRKNKKIDAQLLKSEMLGAGTDPLAKDQHFSQLAGDANLLFNSVYQKPQFAKIRFPPILDNYSRTLANPICTQKYNLSESARIGSNYSKSAQPLFIDLDSKCIRVAKVNESKVVFTANEDLLQPVATRQEELLVIADKFNLQEHEAQMLEIKLASKTVCYERYKSYIENEINLDQVAPIRQYWITDILDLIPADFPHMKREKVEQMIDSMLTEINKFYYQSIRKSILKYVLKDQNERLRIGIIQVLDQNFEDYGQNIYMGLEPAETWRQFVQNCKDQMKQNLVIYSKATLGLIYLWQKYENMLFVQLPSKPDPPLTITQFIKMQDDRLQEVKQSLNSDWLKECYDIYQDELCQVFIFIKMNKNKKQALIFFEANATLMSNQIRQLAISSLEQFRIFFKRFKKPSYQQATDVVQMETDLQNIRIEDVFLTVKLQDHEDSIQFETSLDEIKQNLLQYLNLFRIIKNIIETTHNFQRPENGMARSEKNFIWAVPLEDLLVQEIFGEIEGIIEDNVKVVASVLDIYNQYSYLLQESEKVQKFILLPNNTIKNYQTQIQKYKSLYKDVNQLVPFYVRMNMIEVNGLEVKQKLLETCEQLEENLVRAIHKFVIKRITDLSKEIGDLFQGVQSKAETAEKLVEIERNIEKIRVSEFKKVQHDFSETCKWLFELYNNNFQCEEELKLIHQLSNSVHSFIGKIDHEEVRVKRDREELENKLRKRKEEFLQNIDFVSNQIDQIKTTWTEDFMVKDANAAIDALVKKVQDYIDEMTDINEKEELIGWQPTEFPKLLDAQRNVKPYQQLWGLIRDFKTNETLWIKEKVVFKLDPEEIDRETKAMFTKSQQLINVFPKSNPTCHKLINEVAKYIVDFQKNIPVIKILCNPGLKERHWEEISAATGAQINPEKKDSQMTLKTALQYELDKHLEQIEIINDTATREYAIEQIMNKQLAEWDPIIAIIKPHKDSGTFVVSGVSIEEIQQLLDDQTVKTQTMKGSPFAKIFERRIQDWEDWLQYTFNLTNAWKGVQQTWIYLEPIFSSPDIVKHLPAEAGKFRDVDANWRSLMSRINQTPQVLEFTKNRKLLDLLKECSTNLDFVNKGLNMYMEEKRMSFPRFYFLSNDELLEILSETKDPERVQPHIIKCFEGIKRLKIDELKKIHGMFSAEKEYVDINPLIDTAQARGQVDEWLIQVEKSMQNAIQQQIQKAYEDYNMMAKEKWVLGRCGMAVLCMDMTFWTSDAERYMIEEGYVGASKYGQMCHESLQQIVAIVRTQISSLDRCTLEALIVMNVHNRDVMIKLGEIQIKKISDFDWQSQLRYYWINNNSYVRIINAQLNFNYEYLGNSARLVITPLTDRCYRTLCGALYLNYGGAPEGPAGTGKTETVKDLAKALARQCQVFNCSDSLDYKQMAKFFKGSAQTGCWICFDEFNRINLEVLSVVAQQVQCISLARVKDEPTFLFDGSRLKIIKTCNSFITMNPGYAGRSELPDNLKVLFRTVAMMVPDYAMISEISLYSFGFIDAKNLARKIVTTYALCSEILSSQKHYDYGMRAVKSVLTAAGNLKRKFPDDDENIVMLRSINDVNLAKFLAFDIPLFKGITSDLFPDTELPIPDYKSLFECIKNQMEKLNLTETPYFLEKIIQLYEMILVRHGLMVVGYPFSGKTSITIVLANSLSELCEKQLMGENTVQITRLNPKSISMNQLYGFSDPSTNEWTDGLLGTKFREQSRQENAERKWLIFDGPVDAIWIENMNTVLDDNKKLCLNSGEIIQMSKTMSMIFEPMDLLVASPATVSRCGMVYMEPVEMGWTPIYKSWVNTLQEKIKQEDLEEIDMLFNWAIDPILENLRLNLNEISPTQDQNLVVSLIRMFNNYLNEFYNAQFLTQDIKIRQTVIDSYFVMSIVWSLGGSVNTECRKPFDLFIKKLFALDIKFPDIKTKKIYVPDRGQIFDYKYVTKAGGTDGQWINWNDLIDKSEVISDKLQPSEIIVKTMDTMRYSFLLLQNILNVIPTLFCGQTGTGKSVYIKNVIASQLPSNFTCIDVGFSAQTSAQQTQDIVDGKLERRKKGIFGPKVGTTQGKAVLFVDDLNMPQKEEYGAQPPIEILRQFIDCGGWYDNKDKEKSWRQLADVHFVSAMGPPGGGRTFITPRFLRHLNFIALANFDDDVMIKIFSTILQWFFIRGKFNTDVAKQENKIVTATLDVYKMAFKELLPTPMKSHYLFNLRDFAKVIIGVCLNDNTTLSSQEQVVKIWTHEIMRVFSDRLVNNEDRSTLLNAVKDTVKVRFGLNFDTIFAYLDTFNDDGKKDGTIDCFEIRALMWTDVMNPPGSLVKHYEESNDYQKLQQSLEESLKSYNTINPDKQMDLALFNFAVEHLLIIARMLKLPGGNGLLVGMGGSGRQSLTKLAAKIQEIEVFQIEITKSYSKQDWYEDIKKVLKMAGGKQIPTVFLFSDTQIKNEGFVEDINNLLNTYEVPNIWAQEEKIEIQEMITPLARQQGRTETSPAQLYAFFIEQVRKNLHLMLCFSPIGDDFRRRVRMFPSLVNCCTIDWFFEWPQDALATVAKKFISSIQMEQDVKEKCAELLQYFHASTQDWSIKFFKELGRKYYVTPTSYLEMINSFKALLQERRKEIQSQVDKYQNGFEKIIQTESQVDGMKTNLIDMQPKLIQAKEETEKKIIVVSKEKEIADVLKASIQGEEDIVNQAVSEATEIKNDCQKDLDEAIPALQAAEAALAVLEPKEINLLKSFNAPPQAIKVICKACAIILMETSDVIKTKNDTTLKMEINWWETSKNILNNPKFLNNLINYPKENTPEKKINELGAYLKTQEGIDYLNLAAAQQASQAAVCIFKWTMAIYDFYFVNKKVIPKKKQLAEAEEKTAILQKQLAVKQAELKKAVDHVNNLNADLQASIANKNSLEKRYQECSVQLQRAEILIENLGGEKGRWGNLAKELAEFYIRLTGDVLVASGLMGYLGAFTAKFREMIAQEWVKQCQENNIPSSDTFSLTQVLGDPVKIRAWNIDGLPSDNFSVENAIIIQKSRRWPLMIDPQMQANKWIRKMEGKRKLECIKPTDNNVLRTLENCIQFGKPVLLENVGESLEASLNPILLKQTYQKGPNLYLKVGDQDIEYSPKFFFYMTTKMRNPHYLPELQTKITLLNFMITYEGLNDQLLGILVKQEKPQLEKEKERLILESAENKKSLSDIEAQILDVLANAKNILEDEKGIEVLSASKLKSNEIAEKQIIAEKTEKKIDTARSQYQPMSKEAAHLFFGISDLANIDPMYQYSLTYYIELFSQSIKNSTKSDEVNERLGHLREYFLYFLYCNICRSLFEKDKLLFSFLLSSRILEFKGDLSNEYWRFLLTGGISVSDDYPKLPQGSESWLQETSWKQLCRLQTQEGFDGLLLKFQENLKGFEEIAASQSPQNMEIPIEGLTKFQQLMIIRCLRIDKMIPAVMIFVEQQLGQKFIEPPPFDLSVIYKDSNCTIPLIFVLSPGSDPFASLQLLANTLNKEIQQISLGQGQGPNAQNLINQGLKDGTWVVLQNCHLAVSWMISLDKICEDIKEMDKIHPEFRLWLTSYPSADFPTSILQNGVKMTNEPPKGLRANLTGSFLKDPIINQEFFEGCGQSQAFKRLLYSLCFFHAVIQERKKFGPVGWNIPYEFNDSDLKICVRQLKVFLDEDTNRIDYDALIYLAGECNYGGRVTDDKDRRSIIYIIKDFYLEAMVKDPNYKFTDNEVYKLPYEISQHGDIVEFIKKFPNITQPEVFGLHSNADITKDIGETNLLFDTLLKCGGSGGGGDASSKGEQMLRAIVDNILHGFPQEFDVVKASKQYPVKYEDSMNTVLTQEIKRYNVLIALIISSAKEMDKALKGLVMMSPQLEKATLFLIDGKIPQLWRDKSYESSKPVGSFIIDLKERIFFFQKWIEHGHPNNYWLSGFFFTHSFTTGVKQNYARKHKIPIDLLMFDFDVVSSEITEKPEEGAYIYGMYFEAARWNTEEGCLDESLPKVLYSQCPMIWIQPKLQKELKVFKHYETPLYKTLTRRGILMTSGHSTNFVMYLKIFTKKDPAHWIKRGVALFTQLDD